jgi:hypothetical protein
MRAFARWGGLKTGLLWLASFACYVWGLSNPGLGIVAMGLAAFTPVYAALQLRSFRDEAMGGIISFGRGWGYVVMMLFYACIIFALGQFIYFQWIDKGYFVQSLTQMMMSQQNADMLTQMGMMPMVQQSIDTLRQMRPIDMSLNIMSTNLIISLLIALPIAAIMKRSQLKKVKDEK